MENAITFGILGLFVLLLLVDALRPARAQPAVRGWWLVGIISFVLYIVIATVAPLVWTDLLADRQLLDASGLGTLGGAIVGVVVVDLVTYVWHYALHHVPFLWRWFHQVHHSAERIDTAGAFYFSPLDVVGFAFAGSFALVWAVGVTAEAALIANGIMAALAIFQHANLRTPAWLGYLVQRPEAHNLHHGRGIHRFNYGSLGLWDLVFGTWRNPVEWTGKNGLFDGSTYKLGPMLIGRDIHVAYERESAPRERSSSALSSPPRSTTYAEM